MIIEYKIWTFKINQYAEKSGRSCSHVENLKNIKQEKLL